MLERADHWPIAKEQWLRAMRWRRAVESVLRPLGLTFTRWLVLEATRDLVAAKDDAVSQREVAELCELDRMTVSKTMRGLEADGLIDQGPDFKSSAYRILVTRKGSSLTARARVEVARVRLPRG